MSFLGQIAGRARQAKGQVFQSPSSCSMSICGPWRAFSRPVYELLRLTLSAQLGRQRQHVQKILDYCGGAFGRTATGAVLQELGERSQREEPRSLDQPVVIC